VNEFDSLDRCAAYVAARAAVEAVHDAVAGWSEDQLVGDARRAAVAVVMTIAEAIASEPCSPERRRCLRGAMATAIELAATIDVARALGARDEPTGEAQLRAGRTIAALGMFFHATTHPIVEEDLIETAT
jgi:hypothetical protein